MTRKQRISLDMSGITSVKALHDLLSEALEFPGWYGNNWDAFWDAITGLVEMPIELQLIGWDSFEERYPQDAKIMRECLSEMSERYPEAASQVQYS
jgi:RNAse (barnase) inhibitor barstar